MRAVIGVRRIPMLTSVIMALLAFLLGQWTAGKTPGHPLEWAATGAIVLMLIGAFVGAMRWTRRIETEERENEMVRCNGPNCRDAGRTHRWKTMRAWEVPAELEAEGFGGFLCASCDQHVLALLREMSQRRRSLPEEQK